MGCDCRVQVSGRRAATLARQGVNRVREIESRWSRFLDDSEVSRLNENGGAVTVVSADTYELISRSVVAWYRTGGLFDPTVLDAVESIGYDRDFADIATDGAGEPTGPSPGCSAVELYPTVPAVRLPAGVRFDPGGLGKGLAGDLVAATVMAGAATGVLVDLGGDVVVGGRPPSGGSWTVAVEDPFDPGCELACIQIDRGAVATSSTLIRQWRRDGQTAHHLVDPRTGSSTSGTVAATAVAAAGWWAEAIATASLVGGAALYDRSASVLTVDGDGVLDASHDLDVLVR
jgi:thiamine biosynthesis lipoprotein